MTNPKDNRIEQLEAQLGTAHEANVRLKLKLIDGAAEVERMASALCFVIGWMLHHKHAGEIRIPNADMVAERDCYTFETFPDVTTQETVYKVVYDATKLKEVSNENEDDSRVGDGSVLVGSSDGVDGQSTIFGPDGRPAKLRHDN